MPRREKSGRVVYNWYVKELTDHAKQLFESTAMKEIHKLSADAELDLGGPQPSIGDPWEAPDYEADFSVRVPDGTGKPAVILFEATRGSFVEVRNPNLMPVVERFARKWEKERLELVPKLQARARELLGRSPDGGLPAMFEVRPTVRIIEGYLE